MILIDTNVLVAVANDRDRNHEAAVELLETIPQDLLVTATVIAEVCYLLGERGASAAEVEFLGSFDRGELALERS